MIRLCTICARGGSKGVLNKNIRLLMDKPLIAHTLDQARNANIFDAIAVSSDSDEILRVASKWGCDYVIERPAELATDEAPKLPAIRHCVLEAERLADTIYDTVVDLDATSPLRTTEDIRQAVDLLEGGPAGNVITVMPSRRSPYFNIVEIGEDGTVRLSKSPGGDVYRRQDAPKCYDMNASIYVWNRESLFGWETIFNEDTRAYVMPEERSIDIDSELDFLFVEFLMKSRS
jgi:N-acylneuraminate cytidylyltransferase/CMP-N,N'-diacetyllegionaminic acid synthase